MIQLPTQSEFEMLKTFIHPKSLTIYNPSISAGTSGNSDRIQLKNSLKEARQLLSLHHLDAGAIETLLRPAEKLLDGEEFRASRQHGLALFMHQDFFEYYHLPSKGYEASVTFGTGFELEPLEQIIRDNPPYYVLALSHNDVRLLQGDQYTIEQLDIQAFPSNMLQTLNIDEIPQNIIEMHNVGSAGNGRGTEAFHGQYDKTHVDKAMLTEFFRRIDAKLHAITKDKIPLILGGVEYLLPLYRQVSTYPHLVLDEIRGNLERAPLEFIRERAYALVTPEA
jgi:hypothetical protein